MGMFLPMLCLWWCWPCLANPVQSRAPHLKNFENVLWAAGLVLFSLCLKAFFKFTLRFRSTRCLTHFTAWTIDCLVLFSFLVVFHFILWWFPRDWKLANSLSSFHAKKTQWSHFPDCNSFQAAVLCTQKQTGALTPFLCRSLLRAVLASAGQSMSLFPCQEGC